MTQVPGSHSPLRPHKSDILSHISSRLYVNHRGNERMFMYQLRSKANPSFFLQVLYLYVKNTEKMVASNNGRAFL